MYYLNAHETFLNTSLLTRTLKDLRRIDELICIELEAGGNNHQCMQLIAIQIVARPCSFHSRLKILRDPGLKLLKIYENLASRSIRQSVFGKMTKLCSARVNSGSSSNTGCRQSGVPRHQKFTRFYDDELSSRKSTCLYTP